MNNVSLSVPKAGRDICSFVSAPSINISRNAIELKGNPFIRINVDWSRHLRHSSYNSRCKFSVMARIKKGKKIDYPWPADIDPNRKSEHLSYLSLFKPLAEKPKQVTLDFEKPLVELEKKINEVRKMANETGLDFSDQINLLERKYQRALKHLYTHLTPFQRLSLARHPNRPTFLDHVFNITEKWVELHGDRAGYDDPSIVTGLGSIDGKTYMFIGHQKGRNTKENIYRNFGMPTPHGYRKALRMMRYADHHEFPIITFIDTPGAFADPKCEELGQGEAIAHNLREMFGLKVPIITVVIGEGGSGGALAIGCANKLFMLENAVFYVASPEACAAILWKDSKAAPMAAKKLKITATELVKLRIADLIIPEPIGGAHADPTWTSQQIKHAVTRTMKELGEMDVDTLLGQRHSKFRQYGRFHKVVHIEPYLKRNVKKTEIAVPNLTANVVSELDKLKKAVLKAKEKLPEPVSSAKGVQQLREQIRRKATGVIIAMGLQDKLRALKTDISKAPSKENLDPQIKHRADKIWKEFKTKLSKSKSFGGLKRNLKTLAGLKMLQEQQRKSEFLKRKLLKAQINDQLQNLAKEKTNILKKARDLVAKGEKLDENTLAEANHAKEELLKLLKSAKFEVVGVKRKITSSAPPALLKANDVIFGEIAKSVDASGLKGQVAELRSEIGKGSGADKAKVDSLVKEIREGIRASLDANQLENLVKSSVGLQSPDVVSAVELQ